MELHIKNLGVNKSIDYKDKNNKINYAIFARNGSGKTFISRAFSLMQMDKDDEVTKAFAKKLISFGENSSELIFKVDNGSSSLKIDSFGNVFVNKNLDRIFYVFNSDYIRDNLMEVGYQPSGEIDGVILGRENIDVSKEKSEIESLKKEGIELKSKIVQVIEGQKSTLKKMNVSASMVAYKEIEYENLKESKFSNHNYQDVLEELTKLNQTPDDLENISLLSYEEDLSIFKRIDGLLKEKYTIREYEKEFTNYINSHLEFIEEGLRVLEEKKGVCPFCKQPLKQNAEDIIHQYSEFILDKQTTVQKQIKEYILKIEEIEKKLRIFKGDVAIIESNQGKYNMYLSMESIDFSTLLDNIDILYKEFEVLKRFLQDKKTDITKSISSNVSVIESIMAQIKGNVLQVNNKTLSLNEKYSNLGKLKTAKRREACEEAFKLIRFECNDDFERINAITERIMLLKEEMNKKEMVNSFTKKSKVSSSLNDYIEKFFQGKYKFNTDTFEITAGKRKIGPDASFVLSDGEKSVLAFAHYLANVHTIVNDVDDYDKIIFIIDDPISSMDYQYVYEIEASIKYLKNTLSINHVKKIVLTHNLEFYNLILRNHSNVSGLVLQDSRLSVINKELISTYELHLKDIIDVVENMKIKHTIPNSIRHVIETICNFESGNKDISDFLKSNEEFTNKEYIYCLINDMSHGKYRLNSTYTSQQLMDACNALISFISRKYPDQIRNCRLLNKV